MSDTKDVKIDATNPRWKNCLDKGFVHLVDFMGSDARIVDAARVSYQQGTKVVQSDRHLLRYLIRNLHTTPFEKVVFEFHLKLPIFVARQLMRTRMASYNEMSARYSVMKDEFYVPNPLRKQSSSNRQGSSDEVVAGLSNLAAPGIVVQVDPQDALEDFNNNCYEFYEDLLQDGVARELARTVLPVSLYTEFYWTVNLWNLMRFLNLRLDKHAQYEIRVYAEAIYQIISECCDLKFALEAFQDYILDDPKISKYELQIIRQLLEAKIPSLQMIEAKETVQDLIEANSDMSKREKEESKLIEYLFGKE